MVHLEKTNLGPKLITIHTKLKIFMKLEISLLKMKVVTIDGLMKHSKALMLEAIHKNQEMTI